MRERERKRERERERERRYYASKSKGPHMTQFSLLF